jgi:hypothetical protein
VDRDYLVREYALLHLYNLSSVEILRFAQDDTVIAQDETEREDTLLRFDTFSELASDFLIAASVHGE